MHPIIDDGKVESSFLSRTQEIDLTLHLKKTHVKLQESKLSCDVIGISSQSHCWEEWLDDDLRSHRLQQSHSSFAGLLKAELCAVE